MTLLAVMKKLGALIGQKVLSQTLDLRSFMSSCDLYDLKHYGNFLSWRGKRYTHTIMCRLDKAMTNNDWIMAYPSGRSEYLRFEGSDQRPLVTSFDLVKKKRKGLFRYDRSLKTNEEVSVLIKEAWNSDSYAMIEKRIQLCRVAIIKWCKLQHSNSKQELTSLRAQLDELMSNNFATQTAIDCINQKLLEEYKKEEEFWKQRSQQLWLALGDKNTEYFYEATKGRRAINNIVVIENTEGVPVFEEADIAKSIPDYYQQIFTSQEGDCSSIISKALSPCITDEMNATLITMPTPQEIKQVFFAIHPDKAPGLDGFSASFF